MITRLLFVFCFWGLCGSFVFAQKANVIAIKANDSQATVITQAVNDFLVSLNAETENEAYRNVAAFFISDLLEEGLPNLETRLALKTAFEHKGWYANPVKISNITSTEVNGESFYNVQLERMPVVGGVPAPIQFIIKENKALIVGFKGL